MTAPRKGDQKRLGPIYISPELDAQLDHEWQRMREAFGDQVPKAMLIRIVLSRGLKYVKASSWLNIASAAKAIKGIVLPDGTQSSKKARPRGR